MKKNNLKPQTSKQSDMSFSNPKLQIFERDRSYPISLPTIARINASIVLFYTTVRGGKHGKSIRISPRLFIIFPNALGFLNWPKNKKGIYIWIFLSQYIDKMYFWESLFQNFTKWYFLRLERSVLWWKLGWEREVSYFTTFLSKRVKKGERGTIYLDFFEKLNFQIFRRFLIQIQVYRFWYPFYPFFAGS